MLEPDRRVGRRRIGVILYAAGLAAGLGGLFIPRVREAASRRVEAVFDMAEAGWIRRVEEVEALVAEGSFEDAAARLASLDERFPARNNIHALDKERERVLIALGRANEGLGRKGRALDAYRRAVVFDPLNVENHYELAAAALRLGEEAEAERHLRLILDTYPAHQRAAQDLIGILAEAGDYRAVRETFERYVSAYRVRDLMITAGNTSVVTLPEDGRLHALRVPLPPGSAAGTVRIRPGVDRVRVEEVRWRSRPVAGEPGRDAGLVIPDESGEIALPDPNPAELLIRARAPIPIRRDTHRLVETAYRNLLAADEFASFAPRILVQGDSP